jgi:hypothetical protein
MKPCGFCGRPCRGTQSVHRFSMRYICQPCAACRFPRTRAQVYQLRKHELMTYLFLIEGFATLKDPSSFRLAALSRDTLISELLTAAKIR